MGMCQKLTVGKKKNFSNQKSHKIFKKKKKKKRKPTLVDLINNNKYKYQWEL